MGLRGGAWCAGPGGVRAGKMRPRGVFHHPTAPTQPPGCPRERATTCRPTLPSRARSTRDPRSWSASREGGARPSQGPTHCTTSTDTGMLLFQGPLNRPGGRLWREHGRLEQRQAPAGAGAWPGALAAGSWPLASGSARCACSSQPQAVCFGQQAGRHDALRRAEGELPGCSRRAAPAEPPGPSAAPDSRAEAESTKHAAF